MSDYLADGQERNLKTCRLRMNMTGLLRSN